MTTTTEIALENAVNRVITNNTVSSTDDLANELLALVSQTEAPIHQEIPINSDTLLVDNTTSRFSSAIWYDKIQEQNIILAGIGGIGSYIGFLLARMKPNSMTLYDPDIVEETNLSGQFYKNTDIAQYKVNALHKTISNYASYYNVNTFAERFTIQTNPDKIMICGFDNMEARKVYFNSWKTFVKILPLEQQKECLFLDGRLAAEEFQVFCMTGNDVYNMEKYEKEWLFSDGEADATICSYKQTTFMANMIGSIIVNLFVNHCANMCEELLIPRDLPFYTTYDASTMYFKTIA